MKHKAKTLETRNSKSVQQQDARPRPTARPPLAGAASRGAAGSGRRSSFSLGGLETPFAASRGLFHLPLFLLAFLPLFLTVSLPLEAAKTPLNIKAAHVSASGEKEQLVLTGNVTISDEDFSVQGEELHLDLKNSTAQFVGDVSLTLRDQSLQGKDLWLNLDTREWRFHNARTEIQPGFFKKGVEKPVYLFGEELSGSPREIHLLDGGLTTCNLPHPHYSLKAGEVLIIVGDRLTAHQNSLWIGRRRVVTFPSFSVPLKPFQRPPYLPEMGRNRLEGAFLKSSYNYSASAKSVGTVALALTELQGTATSLQHRYTLPQANGEVYLFRQWEKDALNGRLHHRQTLGPNVELDSSTSYVRNTYYSTAASTTTNSDNTLSYRAAEATTSLSLRTSRTQGNFTRSNVSAYLQHSQTLSPALRVNLSSNFQNFSVPGGFRDKDLQSNLEFTGQAPNFNWRLTEQKRDDLDGDSYTGDTNYSFTERLPELVMETSADRLPWNLLGPVKGNLSLLLSRTTEFRSGRKLFKSSLDVRPSRVEIPFSPSSTLNFTGGFKQSFYEQGSAQYVLQTNADWRNSFGGDWNANLRYAYREAAGFSPFVFDQVPSQSSLDLDISHDKPSARVTLSSGYDLRRATYRDALLRANFQSSPQTLLSLSTAYGIENSRFGPLVVKYSRQPGGQYPRAGSATTAESGRFSFDSSLRYDPEHGKLGTLLTRLNWPISSQWRLETVSGYNGLRGKFDYNDLRLTKDLHCLLTTLTYSQQRRELRFNVMIKAFPILDRYFGVSTYGQQLGTGMGELY